MGPDESATLNEACALSVRHTRSTHEGVQVCSIRGGNFIHLPFITNTWKAHPKYPRGCGQYLWGTPEAHARESTFICHSSKVSHGYYGSALHAHGYFECASRVLYTLKGTAQTLYKVTLNPLCTNECHTAQHSNLANQSSLIDHKTYVIVVFWDCASHSGPRGLLFLKFPQTHRRPVWVIVSGDHDRIFQKRK